jgi:SCY1-like protein 1
MNWLKSTIGLGSTESTLQHNIAGNVASYTDRQGWTLHTGTAKSNGREPVSIFKCKKEGLSSSRREACSNSFTRVKTIRHPNVLKYIEGVETEKELFIVTETVAPLQDWIKQARASNSTAQYEAALAWGLRCICGALDFLNNDCKLIHGFVCSESIFVTPGGDWKLGRLDLVTSMKRHGPDTIFTYNHELLPPQYRSPERLARSWTQIADMPLWAIDVWSFGCLLYEVFSGPLNRAEETQNMKSIPDSLKTAFKRALASNPQQRPSPKQLLRHPFFKRELVDTLAFLDEIAVKEPDEKVRFFASLTSKIKDIPSHVCIYKILPLLKSSMTILPGSGMLTPMLAIGKLMENDVDLYMKHIAPTLVEYYKKNDRSIRVELLTNIESYKNFLENPLKKGGKESVLNQTVFECMLSGFRDSAPQMREITLKTIPTVVPMLNSKNLNTVLGGVVKNLLVDPVPGIRVNATILLGLLADKFDEATKKKLLLPGFTQALNDPFHHNRAVALKALATTHRMYEAKEACAQILPLVVCRLVDDVQLVRDPAFACLNVFVKRLETVSQEMGVVEAQQREKAEHERAEAERKASLEQSNASVSSEMGGGGYGSSVSAHVTQGNSQWENKKVLTATNTLPSSDRGSLGNWGTDDNDDDDFFSSMTNNVSANVKKTSKLDLRKEKREKKVNRLGSMTKKTPAPVIKKMNVIDQDLDDFFGAPTPNPVSSKSANISPGWDKDDDLFGSSPETRGRGGSDEKGAKTKSSLDADAMNAWGDDDVFGSHVNSRRGKKASPKVFMPKKPSANDAWGNDNMDDIFGEMSSISSADKQIRSSSVSGTKKTKKKSISLTKAKSESTKTKKTVLLPKQVTATKKCDSGLGNKDDFFGEFGFD